MRVFLFPAAVFKMGLVAYCSNSVYVYVYPAARRGLFLEQTVGRVYATRNCIGKGYS